MSDNEKSWDHLLNGRSSDENTDSEDIPQFGTQSMGESAQLLQNGSVNFGYYHELSTIIVPDDENEE
ncbi:hypothetical protein GNP94_05250 [Paenibacillus campinasensis]|uniref:DUF4025 domain-containing protein n=1 Tax=Paenibacillus campinasensis TaxID=66347 RepID=A0ABW9SYM7_9BACL|nr:hypothetical protein [Paenibacillus campinasensis]MUG65411.1 hypothetical protein [Paenibacillus campinasensis]